MTLTFQQLADHASNAGASDIHLSADMPPIIRVDGELREVRVGTLTKDDVAQMLDSIMTEQQRTIFKERLEHDFSYDVNDKLRFRVNVYNASTGPAASFRLIPYGVKSLAELQAPAVLRSFAALNKGLILVTGPTGSGKSTTLAALIDHINKSQSKHIITIEDPIEFIHKSDKCLINQREVGAQTQSFANALRSALREDPDIILVGELRDLESIRLALTAAETGHLVFATLHTSSAAQTINRIIDVFPGDDKDLVRTMLSTSLEGVVAQRLIPKANGKGRVAAFEIMVATSAIKNLIRENKIPQIHSLIQVGSKEGMVVMSDYIQNLILQGVISPEEGLSTTRSAAELSTRMTSSIAAGASGGVAGDDNEF